MSSPTEGTTPEPVRELLNFIRSHQMISEGNLIDTSDRDFAKRHGDALEALLAERTAISAERNALVANLADYKRTPNELRGANDRLRSSNFALNQRATKAEGEVRALSAEVARLRASLEEADWQAAYATPEFAARVARACAEIGSAPSEPPKGDEVAWVIVRNPASMGLHYWTGPENGWHTGWSPAHANAKRFPSQNAALRELNQGIEWGDGAFRPDARVEEHMWCTSLAPSAPAPAPAFGSFHSEGAASGDVYNGEPAPALTRETFDSLSERLTEIRARKDALIAASNFGGAESCYLMERALLAQWALGSSGGLPARCRNGIASIARLLDFAG